MKIKAYDYRRERIERINACEKALAFYEALLRVNPNNANTMHMVMIAKEGLRCAAE